MKVTALPFVIPTRISCHVAPERAACAPFRKERRMKCINATNLNRNPGERSRGICGAPRLPHKGLGFVSSHTCSLALVRMTQAAEGNGFRRSGMEGPAVPRKRPQINRRLFPESLLHQCLANRRGVFKSVTGASGSKPHPLRVNTVIDNKTMVRDHRIKTSGRP